MGPKKYIVTDVHGKKHIDTDTVRKGKARTDTYCKQSMYLKKKCGQLESATKANVFLRIEPAWENCKVHTYPENTNFTLNSTPLLEESHGPSTRSTASPLETPTKRLGHHGGVSAKKYDNETNC